MDVKFHSSWFQYLEGELKKDYFIQLSKSIDKEYNRFNCYPKLNQIFSAFDFCPLNILKVVIIGQDPYHGFNQANGLCFSVNDGIAFPPSLVNIFKELANDLSIPIPKSGNLEKWAKQGVFLLNATLTVRENEPNSHQNLGWELFTNQVIQLISDKKENIIFLLWGGNAQKKSKFINSKKHIVLKSGHPSPLSANRGYWFGNNHFSKTNQHLKSLGLKEIDWFL